MIKKNVTVIGTGRLGLCFALVLEKSGYNVIGVDVKEDYVNSINFNTLDSPEPNVNKYLKESKNLKATINLKEGIDFSNIIFVMLRTKTLSNGKYDHSDVEKFLEYLIKLGKQKHLKNLVICSNVCPGYCDEIQERLKDFNYIVNFNPEWVAQGTIIHDYEWPDIIVIGEGNKESGDEIQEIYAYITKDIVPVHRMDRLSAEIVKVGLNSFLTMKITYANMIGDIALQSGVNPEPILRAIGGDSRINTKYFNYGFGYGGPCFPRDTRALIYYGNKVGIDPAIVRTVIETNKNHLDFQVEEFMKSKDKSESVIIDSVTYKKGVTIIEESQQLLFAIKLVQNGYKVIIKSTPIIIEQVKEKYKDLFIYENM